MKRFYIFFSMVLISFYSCSLEMPLPSEFTNDNYLKSESDITAAVDGLYGIQSELSYYKESWTIAVLLSADDLLNGVTTGIYQLFGHNQFNASSSEIAASWQRMYRVINGANLILAKADEIKMSEVGRSRVKGEASFLRAFNYFNLVRGWGAVPLSLEPTTNRGQFNKGKASVDTIYQAIIDDLTFAMQNLPLKNEMSGADRGRPSRGAAQGLLSLVYLTKEDWENAYKNADEVINSGQYSLVQDYAQLWNVARESDNYNEIIYAIQFARDATNSAAGSVGSSLPPIFCPNGPGYTGDPGTDARNVGRGFGRIKVQQWFYDRCLEATGTTAAVPDYRIESSFITRFTRPDGTTANVYPTAGWASERYPYIKKYIDPQGLNQRNHENDFIILRLAELYLIKAEAGNELREKDAAYLMGAYDAFNELRKRARNASGVARAYPQNLPAGLDKYSFRMAVFNERGLELVAEGHRRFDLLRMKYRDTNKSMYEYMLNEFLPSQGWGVPKLYIDGVTYNSRNLLFPIPLVEIAANPITQNAGY